MIDGALAVAVAVATVGFWLWRIPAAERDVVYAEDAEVFLLQGLERGPWHVLLEPYAGYQHLLPRILSALAQLGPLERYGLAAQLASVLVLADGPGRRLDAVAVADAHASGTWQPLMLAVDFLGGTVRASAEGASSHEL